MHILVKIAITLIIGLVYLQPKAQDTYTITVSVKDVSSNDGKLFLALYNKEAEFLDTSFKAVKSEIENKQCLITFKDIPKGTYAVSIFHDENNNGKLDSNFLGIPKEDYGCSNDAKGFMGPPKWQDAKFELIEDTSIIITL